MSKSPPGKIVLFYGKYSNLIALGVSLCLPLGVLWLLVWVCVVACGCVLGVCVGLWVHICIYNGSKWTDQDGMGETGSSEI